MAPRTPLLRPDRYFDERDPSLGRGLLVVAAITVALVAAIYAVGYVMAANVDGTVLVDNPAYPGEMFCEDPPEGDWGCDEPTHVERNVDGIIWDAMGSAAGQAVVLPVLGWLFVGTLLHAGSWLAGGVGGAGRSYAVAAWGMAPGLVAIPVGLAILALTFDPVTVTTATDPAAFRADLFGSLAGLQGAAPVIGLGTSLWGGVIWFVGLVEARGVTPGRAAVIAGVLVLLGLLGGA